MTAQPRKRQDPRSRRGRGARSCTRTCATLLHPRRNPPRALRDGWWWTHGLPPQLVNRGRRHAAHSGGFRRPSHVRATPPCRRPAPTGCGCASPRSGGDHLTPCSPGPALAGGRLHPVAQGGGHLVEPRGREPGDGPGDGPGAFRIGQHRNVLVHKFRDQRYHRGEDRADARGENDSWRMN